MIWSLDDLADQMVLVPFQVGCTVHSDQLDPHQVGQYEVVLVVAATAINVAGSSSVYRAECQPGMYDYQDHL